MSLAAICTGCKEAPVVTAVELETLKAQWKEPKVSIWYYIGTKGGYHYFTHMDVDGTKTYRVQEIDQLMKTPFTLTSDEKKWRVMNWGVHATKTIQEKKPEPTTVPEDTARKLADPQH